MKPQSCLGCPYYSNEGPVYGTGVPTARIAFVSGSLQSSGAERILDNAARRAQINRAREFNTSLVKCHHGPGEPHWQAVKQCRTLLDQELNSLQHLRVIATVGATAFRSFSGKELTSVQNRKKPNVWMRGCPYPVGSKTIVPVLDPAFYMHTGFITAYQFDMDLEKIARFANGQGKKYEVKYNSNPTSQEIQELISDIRSKGRAGIDIETPEDVDEEELRAGGKLLPIEVIGLTSEVGEATGVPPDMYSLLKPLFGSVSSRSKFYVFNGAFDFYHLGKLFGPLEGVKQFDAMLALNRWRSDLQKKDLGTFMSLFTDMPYTKNLAKTEPIKYQWAHVTGVLEGGMKIEKVLEFQGLLKRLEEGDHSLHQDLLDPLQDGLNRMRELGIHADLKEVMKLTLVSQRLLAKYQEAWSKLFPLVDWSSPQQLFSLFTQVFKLPVIERMRVKKGPDGTKTRTKTPTCDVDALEEYRDKYQNKTAGLILAMREAKHLGDFAKIVDGDARVRTAYLIHRQVQFRIQAVEPNIQQLPEELAGFKTRKMVIPDNPENDLIIAIDASQIELRIYAYLSQAKGLLAAMERGEYIYGSMYEQIYHRSFFKPGMPKTKYAKADYVTPQEILAAKSGPLGFIYDRGPESLVAKLGMERTLANQVHAEFHKANPEIRQFHKEKLDECTKLGYQQNLWGGRRYFFNAKGQRNEVYSFHGQSNGAELLRDNYLRPCFRNLKDFNGSRVLLTVHDSMAVNVRGGARDTKLLKDVAQFLYDSAEAPIVVMNGFVIPAEVKWGHNWAEMELFKTHKDASGRTVVE